MLPRRATNKVGDSHERIMQGRCLEDSVLAMNTYGVSNCSRRTELGTCELHVQLEEMVARFVGKEAALTYGMGFATNSTNLPALVSKGCLIVSDELNHASIVLGARLTGAKIKTFRHNDMEHLERVLRTSIVEGQPGSGRAWKKVGIHRSPPVTLQLLLLTQ